MTEDRRRETTGPGVDIRIEAKRSDEAEGKGFLSDEQWEAILAARHAQNARERREKAAEANNALRDLGRMLLGTVCGIGCMAYMALAVKMCWAWFLVPFGAPALSYWWAAGLLVCMMLFERNRYMGDLSLEERWKRIKDAMVFQVVKPTLMLWLGYLAYRMMGG